MHQEELSLSSGSIIIDDSGGTEYSTLAADFSNPVEEYKIIADFSHCGNRIQTAAMLS